MIVGKRNSIQENKIKPCRVTDRDILLLKWINSHGVVQIQHIAQYCQIQIKTAYKRMQKLVANGYVIHEHYFDRTPGIYRVSKQGVQMAQDNLPVLKHVSVATLKHNLLVVDVSLKLISQGYEFITERTLRRRQGLKGVGISQHVCDGVILKDNKRIAIEVELTTKSTKRLERIIQGYRKDLSFHEVWYFCGSNEVRRKVEKVAQLDEFVVCLSLNGHEYMVQ